MEKGLTQVQVQEKQKQYGLNEIKISKPFSALKLLLSQFPTLINGILLLGALFSFYIQEALDGVFILAVLLLNGLLGFFQEYRAEKALEKLKKFARPHCMVIRDGKAQEVETQNLVPGDLVVLNEGDFVAADGNITTKTAIEVDESILTGESLPIEKKQTDTVFRGTYISKGKGQMIVTAIGQKTRIGQISQNLSTIEDDTTPLQKQIISLARTLSLGAGAIAFLLLPIGISEHKTLYPVILLAISIAVAAIPESLPAVITISLALGTNRMASKKAIVRKLASIETIGAVEVVLTDKTGTLTQNDMRVKEFFCTNLKLFHQLIHACVVGNTAHIVDEGKTKAIIGDKTDGALLLWADEQKRGQEASANIQILDEYTFDPVTKTITTVARMHDKPYVIVRGAPETVLARCLLSQKEKEDLTVRYEAFASRGLRVIAIGQRLEEKHVQKSRQQLERDLTFLGFLGLYDPPRKEARVAVLAAQQAGIKVVMVTGDNPLTAQAIATEVGILDGEKTVMTGKEIDSLTDNELAAVIKKVVVFARTTPEHKMKLVEAFQKEGSIVGVTGDGVNDALALKKANVGLAMGQKGTDVAKEASDIVLADDNFATLVEAVQEGRKIYKNIVNAITYLLAGNLAELLFVLFGTLANITLPLLPTQILWINLVTDGLPALALASDNAPTRQVNHPRKKEEPIITRKRALTIFAGGLSMALILLGIFIAIDDMVGIVKARTVVFNLLVVLELIFALIIRGTKGITKNKFFFISIVLTIILQILITFLPFFQMIFDLSI